MSVDALLALRTESKRVDVLATYPEAFANNLIKPSPSLKSLDQLQDASFWAAKVDRTDGSEQPHP